MISSMAKALMTQCVISKSVSKFFEVGSLALLKS